MAKRVEVPEATGTEKASTVKADGAQALATDQVLLDARPDPADLQHDVEAAGHAALVVLKRKMAGAKLDEGVQGCPGQTTAAAARRGLQALAMDKAGARPVFLAALPFGADTASTVPAGLPANTLAGAFVDGMGRPVVLFAAWLDFRTMIGMAPALVLMALSQLSARESHRGAGSLFQALRGALGFEEPFPQWESVEGVVRGVRLRGFGLLIAPVRPTPC